MISYLIRCVVIIFIFIISCGNNKAFNSEVNTQKYKYKDNFVVYNDVLDELIKNHLYYRYTGEDGEILYKEFVTKKIDSSKYYDEIGKIYDNIINGSITKKVIILNTNNMPTYINKLDDATNNIKIIKKYFTDTNYSSIIDSLSSINTQIKPNNFNINLARVVSMIDNNDKSDSYRIGKISFSKIFLNNNKGLIYYSFNCDFSCGKDAVLFIKKIKNKWVIEEEEILLIY